MPTREWWARLGNRGGAFRAPSEAWSGRAAHDEPARCFGLRPACTQADLLKSLNGEGEN